MKLRKLLQKRRARRERFKCLSKSRWKRSSCAWYVHRARHFKPGSYIETCGCDVAQVVLCENDDLEYRSLTTNVRGSCSLFNCGPIRLNETALARRLTLFREGGKDALTLRYYTEDCGMSRGEALETLKDFKSQWGEPTV